MLILMSSFRRHLILPCLKQAVNLGTIGKERYHLLRHHQGRSSLLFGILAHPKHITPIAIASKIVAALSLDAGLLRLQDTNLGIVDLRGGACYLWWDVLLYKSGQGYCRSIQLGVAY